MTIPAWLEGIAVRLVLFRRRLRHGYAFHRIPLTQGRFAIVDPADYARLSRYKWRLCKTKGKNVLYAERSIRRPSGRYSRILMHRQLIQPPEGYVIDHINRCGLDNRRANLRLATVAQNAWSANKRNPRSGCKGVFFEANNANNSFEPNFTSIYLGSQSLYCGQSLFGRPTRLIIDYFSALSVANSPFVRQIFRLRSR